LTALTDALGEVCRLVCADPTAAAVARALGEVLDEQEDAVQVRPRDEHFDDAYVVHEDDGEVLHIDLTLREPAPLADLESAFGAPRTVPRRPRRPPQRLFTVGDCTVIVSVADDTVSAVTVRRDV
jgi:hypothetical protein